jgi:hypothetical protein
MSRRYGTARQARMKLNRAKERKGQTRYYYGLPSGMAAAAPENWSAVLCL